MRNTSWLLVILMSECFWELMLTRRSARHANPQLNLRQVKCLPACRWRTIYSSTLRRWQTFSWVYLKNRESNIKWQISSSIQESLTLMNNFTFSLCCCADTLPRTFYSSNRSTLFEGEGGVGHPCFFSHSKREQTAEHGVRPSQCTQQCSPSDLQVSIFQISAGAIYKYNN